MSSTNLNLASTSSNSGNNVKSRKSSGAGSINSGSNSVMVMSRPHVLSVSVNEEGTLFAACMDKGVRIYGTHPLVGKLFLDASLVGSVSLCSLLGRSNFCAIVGSVNGSQPKFAENSVLIWDDSRKKFVLEYTFHTSVLALRLRPDALLVAERTCIHCFSFPNKSRRLFTVATRDNPLGLFQVTPTTSSAELSLLVYPGHVVGTVQLLDLSRTTSKRLTNVPNSGAFETFSEATSSISPTTISAHQSEIGCLALNTMGTLMATASQKGTLIRIFRTVSVQMISTLQSNRAGRQSNESSGYLTGSSGESYIPLAPVKIAEFRRGMDAACVYCIVFSPDSEFVMASSDKGTVHIFALKETRLNRRSTFSSVPFMNVGVTGTYTDSQWALAKFTVPAECACLCTFGPEHQTVNAICVDGSYHRYQFSQDGVCTREHCGNYLDVPEEEDHILY